jgi:hypothetical protein
MPIQTIGQKFDFKGVCMKLNPLELYELTNVEELEEKSAPAIPTGGRPVYLPDTICWDD